MAMPAATITLAAIMRPVEKGWLGACLWGALRLWDDGEVERALAPGPASRLALAWIQTGGADKGWKRSYEQQGGVAARQRHGNAMRAWDGRTFG